MRRLPLVVLPLLATACVFPNHKASKVVEFTLPATHLQRLQCESHNGDITITGTPDATEIALRAELSVRGTSQAEADANLNLMEVGREENGDLLHVFGKHPTASLSNRSPSYKFTLRVPAHLTLQLESHNGDIAATGMNATAKMETHNGDISAQIVAAFVEATSHNGDVALRIDGDGALDGSLTTHNGDIDLTLGEGRGTMLDASTHNGRVTPPNRLVDASVSKRKLACRIGDGQGKLIVNTHNGNVVVR
jgi:DUF4097 and DUF4098 domain-containing protein YvlB